MSYNVKNTVDDNWIVVGTKLARKETDIDRIKEDQTIEYKVVALITLEEDLFEDFKGNTLDDYDFLKEAVQLTKDDSIANSEHVFLLLKEGYEVDESSLDDPVALLVDTQGYHYARYLGIALETII